MKILPKRKVNYLHQGKNHIKKRSDALALKLITKLITINSKLFVVTDIN